MTDFTASATWQALKNQQAELTNCRLANLFTEDADRFKRFSVTAGELTLDYSKNLITQAVMDNLLKLTNDIALEQKIKQLLNGDKVNFTEFRPAWHTALRDAENQHVEVEHELRHAEKLAAKISVSDYKHVVNLGIGGSDLGPALVVEALAPYRINDLNFHFISNVDPSDLDDVLRVVEPKQTLFIVASKSFTTLETLANAEAAKKWLTKNNCDPTEQMYAVTTNAEKAIEFGISEEHVLHFWNWVGGRYSLWSTIGFAIILALGMNNFRKLLAGAHQMDQHFAQAAFTENMPVILALLSVWYINFWGTTTQAILPYDQHLRLFPDYLQQLVMESNGKSARVDNTLSSEPTSPVIWGQVGTNGQHAFYQMLHQGTQLVPVDFILPIHGHQEDVKRQELLVANCIAQSEALMLGKVNDDAHQFYPGNRPSNTILMPQLNPQNLGALIALYEHKTYVESVIWHINAFDQWGVELGKKLAKDILQAMHNSEHLTEHDSSTQAQINYYKNTH